MNSFNEVIIVDDLIEADGASMSSHSKALWTEQALDLFISQLQIVSKKTFSSEHEMLAVVMKKMFSRNLKFSVYQLEKKYNDLKSMYNDKKQRNQEIEPELVKLFGNVKRPKVEEVQQNPVKKLKIENSPNSSRQNKSSAADEVVEFEEDDKCKIIWTNAAHKMFVDLLDEHRPKLGSVYRTKKQMWEHLSKIMVSRGFNLTPTQVENKWKSLVRDYRNRLQAMNNLNSTPSPIRSTSPSTILASSSKKKSQKKKKEMEIISFANDHKLPFDDDENENENENDNDNDNGEDQFEETCSLPGNDEDMKYNFDAVNVSDEKYIPIPNTNTLSDESASKFEQISKEMSYFRKDLRRYQSQVMALKREQLEVAREQKEEFTRIGDTLTELLRILKRRDGEI